MFGNIVFLLFFWDGSSTCAWGSRRIGVVVKCRHCIHGEISGPVCVTLDWQRVEHYSTVGTHQLWGEVNRLP